MRNGLRETAVSSEGTQGTEGAPAGVSDELLMVAFSRGSSSGSSKEAFGELFSRYKQPVFGFFRRRVVDPALAEELTQETFLAVLGAATRYEPSATFRTYLYAIGFNVLRAHRRKAAFRAMFSSTDASEKEPVARGSLDADVVLRDAVGRLERVDREILLLREFEELSYAEIAELLKLPLNTVRSRLFRARLALRELLAAPASGVASKFREGEERV
jgi:RNA polymerase sigma-70 factor (ECF subfamily)